MEQPSIFADREVCLTGERMNFSVWHEQSHPTELPLSTTMYVELLDGLGGAIASQKYRIRDGRCRGVIEIPPATPTGVYFLRAYTRYQRNYLPESHATTAIILINPDENIPPVPVKAEENLKILQESRHSEEGLRTHLLLKAPVTISSPQSLSVQSGDEQLITEVLQIVGPYCHLQIVGAIPTGSKVILRQSDKTWSSPIAGSSKQELALEVSRSSESSLEIEVTPVPDKRPSQELILVLTDRNFQPLYERNHGLTEDGTTIQWDDLPATVRYLFAKTVDGQVLAASVIPAITAPRPELTLSTDRLAPRQSATLTIGNHNWRGVNVSVFKAIPLPPEFYLDLIWTNPWLMDLMPLPDSLVPLANMIRSRYLYEHVDALLNASDYRHPPESRDMGISGRVVRSSTKEPVENILTIATVVGEHPQLHTSRTDSTGQFRIPIRNLEGTETVFISVRENENQDLQINIDQDFRSEIPAIRPVPMSYDSAFHQAVETLYKSHEVMDRVRQIPREVLLPVQHAPTFPINLVSPAHSVDVEKFVELPSVEEVLHNIVPYVGVQRRSGKKMITVDDSRTLQTHRNPLILLDYAAVFDIEALLELAPQKIRQVDVYEGSYYIGDERFDGIVSIFTNTNNFARYPLSRHGVFVSLTTLQPTSAVEAVNHSVQIWPTHLPDFRSLLYWHPAPEASARIQAGDLPGTYRVRLSGVAEDGSIISTDKLIEVEGGKDQ